MDIHDLHEELVKKLTIHDDILQVSLKFCKITNSAEKIKYALSYLKPYNLMKDFKHSKLKNDSLSIELRQEGNDYYTKKRMNYEALLSYNQSICLAETGSENLGVGYSNRSAVYFELKDYEKSLKNITLAKSFNLPAKLKTKLKIRENICLDILEKLKFNPSKSKEKKFQMKMTYKSNPITPNIAECLELVSSEDQGRYIVTNKNLSPGDVLAIEEPVIMNLDVQLIYTRCTYCMIEGLGTLIPCPNCTKTMFCDKNCYDRAYKEYHKYECGIVDDLLNYFNRPQYCALRTALYAFNKYEKFSDLVAAVENSETKNVNVFNIKNEPFQCIHNLATNQEKRNNSDLFKRAIIGAVLNFILEKYTPFKELVDDEEKYDFFLTILFRYLQMAPTNYHSLHAIEDPDDLEASGVYGSGAYPFSSLVNHSCAPNVERVCMGNKIAMVVLRPLKIGQQLFDNYGLVYIHPKTNLILNVVFFQFSSLFRAT